MWLHFCSQCVHACRHPLLHADYLIQREAQARSQPQSSRAAAAGPLRRLSNRKDVMARNLGTTSDVRTQLYHNCGFQFALALAQCLPCISIKCFAAHGSRMLYLCRA